MDFAIAVIMKNTLKVCNKVFNRKRRDGSNMVSRVASAKATQTSAQTKAVSQKASSGFSTALKNAVEQSQNQKTSGSLDDIFNEASSKYHVPVRLLKAVAKAESGFQADAVSCCGAQGIMQLMPSTAASLGVQNSFDPEQNIMGGAKYISQLLSSFDGNAKLAVAAYNAGSGSVKKYGGVPPYAETQNYVKKVLGYADEDISTAGWSSGLQTSTADTSSSVPATDAWENAIGLGNISFSESDYQLFAKMYVQRLEQNALDTATASAAERAKHLK